MLNVLKDIDLDPKYLLIFLHPSNTKTIKILNGSGDFRVTANDTSKAGISYNSKSRTVDITPLELGVTKIIVEDR